MVRPLKRHLINLLVLTAAFAITLLIAEIGFRFWAGWRRGKADPVVRMGNIVRPAKIPGLVYEYIPGPPHTNSAGLRGPEVSLEKPPHTIRVAGIGDSVMAADLYKPDEAFMSVLGWRLNEAATSPMRFETLNFAVGGYNMFQNAIVLKEKALAFRPDWVVLGIVINDAERPVYYQVRDARENVSLRDRYQDEKRFPFSAGIDLGRRPWWFHSILARFVHYRTTEKSRYFEGFSYFKSALAEIASTGREHGIPILAVALTELAERGEKQDPRATWHAVVREACAETSLPLLEMYPRIMRYLEENKIPSYKRYWSGPLDAHPNAEGHRLIAEFIFERLKEMAIFEMKPRDSADVAGRRAVR